jgi:hypothetical protein
VSSEWAVLREGVYRGPFFAIIFRRGGMHAASLSDK